jgi:hypothetical protein
MSGFDYRTAPDLGQVSTSAVFLMKRHETSILTGGKEKRKAGNDPRSHPKSHETPPVRVRYGDFVDRNALPGIEMRKCDEFRGIKFV